MKRVGLSIHRKCPCEQTELLLKDCCLFLGNFLRKKVATLTPPGSITGFSQNGCYLSDTQNCSQGLSAEHYMSRAVLEAINERIEVSGAPWLPVGESKELSINNLTSRILCKRHNESLSPLDTEAGNFFRKIKEFQSETNKKSLSSKGRVTLLSGEMLELWMLKVAAGFFFSKNAADSGNVMLNTVSIQSALISKAFYNSFWSTDRCGLYMKAPMGHVFKSANAVAMAPLTTKDKTNFVGVRLHLSGMEFILIFDPIGIDALQLQNEGLIHRPTELLFPVQKRSNSIALTWLPGQKEQSIRFESRRSY